jgi:hypothetical protein
MLMERVTGLKIMCNESDSIRVALEALLLLLCMELLSVDILHSLVAVGREFAFPIDFSSRLHWELTPSPSAVMSYSKELATHLSACHEVEKLVPS